MGLKTSYFKLPSNKLQTLSYVLREEIFSILKISDKREKRRKEWVAREVGYISWDTLRK